jgi:tetraacyldisaccharide 4'-kinase
LSLEAGLVRCWYGRSAGCRWLIPLSALFSLLSYLRRALYRWGWLPVARLPVPVIVVGNITVGGTGKTPLVIWLAERLRAHGYRPGIVSRGYAAQAEQTEAVDAGSDPARAGDEPVLIARRSGCPVRVGRRRAEAARALIAAHPEIDVILSDDGLQHYALGRDVEVAVVDGQRRFGNGWPLPAGPLREPVARLREADAVVVNGESGDWLPTDCPVYAMQLTGTRFHALHARETTVAADHFAGRSVHAVAGIGNPQRFFDALAALGLNFVPHPFPDHHAYSASDLPAGTVVMTEKDAVKCVSFAHADTWVLAVDARVQDGLERYLLDKLEMRHGQQAA